MLLRTSLHSDFADDGSPGGGIREDAPRHPPMPKPEKGLVSDILKVGRFDKYVDDLSGTPLPPDLCHQVRAE